MLRNEGGQSCISEFIFEIKDRCENIWLKACPCAQDRFKVSMWGWNLKKMQNVFYFHENHLDLAQFKMCKY